MLETNKIYCMDAIEFMKQIDDESVDLAIIDPPYNIGKDEWDKVTDYNEWIGKILKECERVLKDTGSLYLWHNQFPTMANIQVWMDKNTKFKFKSLITWEKYQTNKQYYGRNVLMGLNNRHKRNYYPMAEYCLFYTFQEEWKGHSGIFDKMRKELNEERIKAGFKNFREVNKFLGVSDKGGGMACHYFSEGNQIWELPTKEMYQKLQKRGFKKPYENLRSEFEELKKEYEKTRYTFNFVKTDVTTTWLFPPEKKEEHLTPKSKQATKLIIKTSSKKRDLVLIPFVGSGTEVVICKQEERDFIGCDNNEEYVKIANKRLAQQTLSAENQKKAK